MDQADTDFRIFADRFGDRSGNRLQERVAMFDRDGSGEAREFIEFGISQADRRHGKPVFRWRGTR
jgi:hypothetical protein